MVRQIRSAQRRDGGATAIEYSLLVAAIAAIIVLLVFSIGKLTKQAYNDTCTAIKLHASTAVASQSTCS